MVNQVIVSGKMTRELQKNTFQSYFQIMAYLKNQRACEIKMTLHSTDLARTRQSESLGDLMLISSSILRERSPHQLATDLHIFSKLRAAHDSDQPLVQETSCTSVMPPHHQKKKDLFFLPLCSTQRIKEGNKQR